MLKIAARSKRGAKQIKRHGNRWMPVQADRCVGCLGGKAGIKLMSIQDKATFWMKVEDDENLMVVERLDNFGRSIPKPGSVLPLSSVTPEPVELEVEFNEKESDPLERARRELVKHIDRQVLKEFISDGSFGTGAERGETQDNPGADGGEPEGRRNAPVAA